MIEINFPPPGDPRTIPMGMLGNSVEGIEADLSNRPLPCGREDCNPFSRECVQFGPDAAQAVIACGREIALGALMDVNLELEEENTTLRDQIEQDNRRISAHEELIRQLSIDSNTGVLTLNAQNALFERPETIRILEQMKVEGYTFVITIFDMDKLKTHNSLGGHEDGGDPALHTTITKIKELFRRGYDVVGILETEREAGEAVDGQQAYDVVSRFERGDEVIVMSFIPPTEHAERRNRRTPADVDTNQLEDHIDAGFDNLEVTYPLRAGISEAAIAQARESGLEFVITDTPQGPAVTASVSATYSGVVWQVPVNRDEFEKIAGAAERQLMLLKDSRDGISTTGNITDTRSRARVRKRPGSTQ